MSVYVSRFPLMTGLGDAELVIARSAGVSQLITTSAGSVVSVDTDVSVPVEELEPQPPEAGAKPPLPPPSTPPGRSLGFDPTST
jgi:hypothetical protein